MLTNTAIARAIATAAIAANAWSTGFVIEDVDSVHAPYDGVMIMRPNGNKCVHVYFCDDGRGEWMIDPSNFETGDVDPQPLNAMNLQRALEWLAADAWLYTSRDATVAVSTMPPKEFMKNATGPVFASALSTIQVGATELVAWFDPTTGDLAIDDGMQPSFAPRFTHALFKLS